MNIVSILEQHVSYAPLSKAVIDHKGELTYKELFLKVHEAIESFRAYKIVEGMTIGLQIKNSREFIIALLAVCKLGAIAVPIGAESTHQEIKKFTTRVSLHGILKCNEENQFDFQELLLWEGVSTILHIKNPAVIRPTSGSTGLAKGVVFSHEALIERLNIAQASLKLTSDDRILWILPMSYHFIVSILLYLYVGACIVICKDTLSETILDAAFDHKATFLYASPLQYALLAEDTSGRNLSVRQAISTASSLSASTAKKFKDRFGIPLQQIFGIIECGLPLGTINCSEPEGSIGFPMHGFEIKLFDGELALRGPGMFDGYLSPPVSRNEITKDGWFMTGDIAKEHTDGSFSIIGRKKSVIITVGNKVFPEEVEEVINEYPGVMTSRVFAKPHAAFGEIVCTEVVLKEGHPPEAIAGLRKFCKERLSSFKVPQEVTVVDTVQMTPTGKIARAAA